MPAADQGVMCKLMRPINIKLNVRIVCIMAAIPISSCETMWGEGKGWLVPSNIPPDKAWVSTTHFYNGNSSSDSTIRYRLLEFDDHRQSAAYAYYLELTPTAHWFNFECVTNQTNQVTHYATNEELIAGKCYIPRLISQTQEYALTDTVKNSESVTSICTIKLTEIPCEAFKKLHFQNYNDRLSDLLQNQVPVDTSPEHNKSLNTDATH